MVAALALSTPASADGPAAVFDGDLTGAGGIACAEREGVRWCEGSATTRVRTFDGVPLDVNVALPAEGAGDWPLVIHIHGWGGRKGGFTEGKQWAERGYAFMSVTSRGFNESCGTAPNRNDQKCVERGWIRLADSRYEVRDLQHLAGLLADEGVADPQRIGAYGGSYGGGQSTMLAVLRDRIRDTDGSYKPWVSPARKLPMQLAAAVPSIPWTDLVYSLMPNGRTLDYALTDADDDLSPIGVMKSTFVSGLFATGNTAGYYAPPGADLDADLITWYGAISAGDPYDESPLAQMIAGKIAGLKSPFYLDMTPTPAPTLISNGFTDDLFPVDEAVRYSNKVHALHPEAVIAQVHFDYGHQRGQNKGPDTAFYAEERRDWFDRYLQGDESATPLEGVTVMSLTCPKATASEGPFTAPTWDSLSPGEVRLGDAAAKSVAWIGSNPQRNQAFDPVAGGGACATTPDEDTPGTANYRLPTPSGDGYTLAGSGSVVGALQLSCHD
jgi:hypothetical protein